MQNLFYADTMDAKKEEDVYGMSLMRLKNLTILVILVNCFQGNL